MNYSAHIIQRQLAGYTIRKEKYPIFAVEYNKNIQKRNVYANNQCKYA